MKLAYLLLLTLVTAGCVGASPPISAKYHFGERVSYQSNFYGRCVGRIDECYGYDEFSYVVVGKCSFSGNKIIRSQIRENDLTKE
jgi:hypothetical protein